MKTIPLTRNKFALVDDEDYEALSKLKWYCDGKFYARNKTILMHRVIMKAQKGQEIDHKDGNSLNNQKSNLRFCTHQENMRNRKLSKNNTSGYAGVQLVKKKHTTGWTAQIWEKSKRVYLGYFKRKSDAIEARRKAVELMYNKPQTSGL